MSGTDAERIASLSVPASHDVLVWRGRDAVDIGEFLRQQTVHFAIAGFSGEARRTVDRRYSPSASHGVLVDLLPCWVRTGPVRQQCEAEAGRRP